MSGSAFPTPEEYATNAESLVERIVIVLRKRRLWSPTVEELRKYLHQHATRTQWRWALKQALRRDSAVVKKNRQL